MGLRGETIGTAYIRILADGGGFSDSVRDEVRKDRGGMDKAGREHGQEYIHGFASELEKEGHTHSASKQLQDSLQRGAGRFDAVGAQMSDHMMDGLRNELRTQFPKTGDLIFKNLQEQMNRGQLDFPGLRRALENIRPEVDKALKQLEQGFLQKMGSDFDELGRKVGNVDKLLGSGGGARKRYARELKDMVDKMPNLIRDTESFKNRVKELEGILRPAGGALGGLARTIGRVGDGVGKAFGKGSRNDFLNFFGSFMSILPTAAGAAVSFVGSIKDTFSQFADTIKTTFNEAGGGVKGFGSVLSGLAQEGIPGLAAAAGAVVLLGEALALSLGPLTSGAVLLTGVVLALAGSLSFALVGGLVAVGGALVPFAAALGVGALAIGALLQKGKDLKNLKKDWHELQTETAKEVFGSKQEGLKALRDLMAAVKPLILGVASAVGDVLRKFDEAAKSGGFRQMMQDIGAELGPMVKTLGDIALNIGKFFGEALLAAGPMITQFLNWVKGITGQLAASGLTPGAQPGGQGGGKSPLQNFLDRAWFSAKAIWQVIKDVVGIVGTLLSSGKDTGDNIFVRIDGWLKGIQTKLDQAKQNGALQQLWDDAQRLAGEIGFVILQIDGFIQKVDTPTNRLAFTEVISIIGTLIGWIGTAIGWVDRLNFALYKIGGSLFSGIVSVLSRVGAAISSAFQRFVGGIVDAFRIGTGQIRGIWNAVLGFLRGAWSAFSSFFSGIWRGATSLFHQGVNGIRSAFSILGGQLRGIWSAVTGFISRAWSSTTSGIRGAWNSARGALSSGFNAIKGAASSAFNAIKGAASDAFDFIASLPSRIGDLAGQMFNMGVNAGQSLVDGIRSVVSGILSHISLGSLNLPAIGHASGGYIASPTFAMVGEAGPEAIVPLNRPLSQVDPAVRTLSAIAQGLVNLPVAPDRGKRIQIGQITVVTPTEDPRAVASEVVARMAAASYIG